jgi:hypothetical protein
MAVAQPPPPPLVGPTCMPSQNRPCSSPLTPPTHDSPSPPCSSLAQRPAKRRRDDRRVPSCARRPAARPWLIEVSPPFSSPFPSLPLRRGPRLPRGGPAQPARGAASPRCPWCPWRGVQCLRPWHPARAAWPPASRGSSWSGLARGRCLTWRGLARDDLRRARPAHPRGFLARGSLRSPTAACTRTAWPGPGTRTACSPAARSGHGARDTRGQLDRRPMPSLANFTSEGPLFLLLLSTLFYFYFANRTLMDHVNNLVLF